MFLRINDYLAHVRLSGNPGAPAIVLLHSLGTCADVWDMQARTLEADHLIVRPEFRGHGLAEESREQLSIERLADDVLAILDALSIDGFVLAGISIGGMVAQAVAARAGRRVSSLALFDTTIASPEPTVWKTRAQSVRARGLAAIADDVFARWVPSAERGTPDSAGLLQMLRRTSDEGYAAGCDALASADCRPLATLIEAPTIVAVGTEDRATPPSAAETLAAAIAGARLERIEGAGHIPLFSHAKAVNLLLAETVRNGQLPLDGSQEN